MSFQVTIVALAVIIVVVAIFAPSLFDNFFQAIDTANGVFTATQLTPRIGQDEIICDLRVKVNAELVQGFGILGVGDSPFIQIDKDNSHTYEWFECSATSVISALDLADFDVQNPQLLDFFSFGGETIATEIVLRDSNDNTQKVDAFTQPQMRRLIQLQEGLISTPLDMSMEFVVKNIPTRDYTLEIYYGRIINGMDAGEPFITSIKGL